MRVTTLDVACPMCGRAPGRKCIRLDTEAPTAPHQPRRRRAAEEQARREQEERERMAAEEQARQEKERLDAEAKAKREREEAEHLEAYERALREAEDKEKSEAEHKAKQAEEDRKRKEQEEYEREFARLEAEENARKEAEAKAAKAAEDAARKQAEASRPKTQEELEMEAYEAAIRAAEGTIGAPAPPVSTAGGAAAAPALASQIDTYRAKIREQITSLAPKQGAVATIVLGALKLLLSSWEVAAYATGSDVTAEVLQRAVAGRAVLLIAIDHCKYSGNTEELRTALWQVQVEVEKIQARVAVAKDTNDIDAACNLAATSKRLMALVDEAEKLKQ